MGARVAPLCRHPTISFSLWLEADFAYDRTRGLALYTRWAPLMSQESREHRQLGKFDLLVGTVMATVLVTGFIHFSPGWALIVTFVPGMVASAAILWVMFVFEWPLPEPDRFLPIYILGLALQMLHCAEEFAFDFMSRFPALYGGEPFTERVFVLFNLIAYALFAASGVLATQYHLKWLFLPALFFVVYGGLGNAIAHTFWAVHAGAYFPGFVTGLVYWWLGPLMLTQVVGSARTAVLLMILLAGLLVPLLAIFITA